MQIYNLQFSVSNKFSISQFKFEKLMKIKNYKLKITSKGGF